MPTISVYGNYSATFARGANVVLPVDTAFITNALLRDTFISESISAVIAPRGFNTGSPVAFTTGEDYRGQELFGPDRQCIISTQEIKALQGSRVYHLCKVHANALSFEVPQNRCVTFYVYYRPDKPFNVSAPKLNESCAVPIDAMKGANGSGMLYADKVPFRESETWKKILNYLPNGWYLSQFNDYERLPPFYQDFQNYWIDVYRCHETFPIPTLNTCSLILLHPSEPRELTIDEAARLVGWYAIKPRSKIADREIAGNVVPVKMAAWIAANVKQYLAGGWTKDFDSTFDTETNSWKGKTYDTPPAEKTFDLSRFVPDCEIPGTEFPIRAKYRFNFDTNTNRYLAKWDTFKRKQNVKA